VRFELSSKNTNARIRRWRLRGVSNIGSRDGAVAQR
jgi:hypothetical protein